MPIMPYSLSDVCSPIRFRDFFDHHIQFLSISCRAFVGYGFRDGSIYSLLLVGLFSDLLDKVMMCVMRVVMVCWVLGFENCFFDDRTKDLVLFVVFLGEVTVSLVGLHFSKFKLIVVSTSTVITQGMICLTHLSKLRNFTFIFWVMSNRQLSEGILNICQRSISLDSQNLIKVQFPVGVVLFEKFLLLLKDPIVPEKSLKGLECILFRVLVMMYLVVVVPP